jgi:hypothetical protein
MPGRTIAIDGHAWEVGPTGRVTQYGRDEFGLLFHRVGGGPGALRVVRYAPLGARAPEDSLAELSDHELAELWHRSQPSWTAPETGYQR